MRDTVGKMRHLPRPAMPRPAVPAALPARFLEVGAFRA